MQTIQFNSDHYRDAYLKQHNRYEKYAYKQFKAALNEQTNACLSHLKTYGSLTTALIDLLVRRKPVEDAYRAVYTKVGVLHAAWTMKAINTMGKKSLFSYFSDKWRQLMEAFFLNESADMVTDVTETTRDKIKQALADSEELPISQRATYLEKELGSEDFNRSRSLMIARTETTRAANKGASLGNLDADYETAKQWIAVLDSNTRPDHANADGQIVPNLDTFNVGGYECQYPGDATLPAKESINCRCCVAYVPLVGANGLPILK